MNNKKVLATKEIKFKAGISTADLERKVGNIISYLVKGHTCQVTVTSAFRRAIQNNAIVESLHLILVRLMHIQSLGDMTVK